MACIVWLAGFSARLNLLQVLESAVNGEVSELISGRVDAFVTPEPFGRDAAAPQP